MGENSSRRWWMLGVLCLAVLVVNLDVTVLNVALPTIAGSLHASNAELQWIVDSYTLAYAGMMLPAGLLGDRFGRKRLLLIGLVIFGGASVWAGLASSTAQLIAARTLQGVGAAVLLPLTLAIVTTLFEGRDRLRAIGLFTAVVAAGMPLGPIVGRALLRSFSWNSVFWANVPVIAVGLVGAVMLLKESLNPAVPPLDLLGAVLSVGGVVAVVYGVISGPELGWGSARTVGVLAVAAVLLVAFVVWQGRTPHPLADAGLFRDRRFTWGTAASVIVTVALIGILVVMPQYLQAVRGNDAFGTGLRLLPLMAGLLVGGVLSARIDRLIGTKIIVAASLLIVAAGLVVLGRASINSEYGVIAIGLAGSGLGFGIAMVAGMAVATAAVGGAEAGAGSVMINTLRQLGGALAVAALGSVLSAVYSHRLEPALRALPGSSAATGSRWWAPMRWQVRRTRSSGRRQGSPSAPGCRRSCLLAPPSRSSGRCCACGSCRATVPVRHRSRSPHPMPLRRDERQASTAASCTSWAVCL
jgi:EmrB/QacA subfamily drug resistance transporter